MSHQAGGSPRHLRALLSYDNEAYIGGPHDQMPRSVSNWAPMRRTASSAAFRTRRIHGDFCRRQQSKVRLRVDLGGYPQPIVENDRLALFSHFS
jgi:hypothetical protein